MKIKCPDCNMIFELTSDMIVNENNGLEENSVKDLNENAPISNSVSSMDAGLMGALDNLSMGSPTGSSAGYHDMIANAQVGDASKAKATRVRKKPAVDVVENSEETNVPEVVFASELTQTTHELGNGSADLGETLVNTAIAKDAADDTIVVVNNTNDNDDSDLPTDAADDDDDEEIVTNTNPDGTVIGSDKYGFKLTNDNYYSDAANKVFMSNSLFKAVYGTPVHPYPCEDAAINGPKAESEALLIGGYVDSWFEGQAAFDAFKADHQDQLLMKSGKDYYKFVKDADEALDKVSKDPVFMDYAKKGSHQTIMVGEIAGQPFKIKMDAYHANDKIVDVKYVKDASMVWNDIKKEKITFIEDYGYNIQGAIYQEIVYQNTGKKLPFYIAFITKERDECDFDIVQVDQKILDEALEFVKMQLISRPYADVLAAPQRCGRKKCAWCKSKKILKAPKTYDEFVKYCS